MTATGLQWHRKCQCRSLPQRVIKVLEKVIWLNGKPRNIRCDNGPEFISKEFQQWCAANDIRLLYTQPGCPTQNRYIERFNGSYRRAVLDAYIFGTIDEVRLQTEAWCNYYNNERPHESLNNMTTYEYRALQGQDKCPAGSLAYISGSCSLWPIINQSTTATYGWKTKKHLISSPISGCPKKGKFTFLGKATPLPDV